MRCTDCGLYECCLRTPLGGCPNGEKAELSQIYTTPNIGHGPWEKDYQPSGISAAQKAEKDINREMIGRMQKVHEKWTDDMFKDFDYNITIQDPIRDTTQALVDAIERYVQQRCSRSELLNIKNKLKNLLK